MKFGSNIIGRYIALAPLALALERIVECRIFEKRPLDGPILDLGCGDGLFAHVLFVDKIETGIDLNSRELQRAKELDSYYELIECPGDNIPKPDCSYQTIISNSVLEHIPNLEPVFLEAYRILAPGGCFYFTVPSKRFEEFTFTTLALQQLGLTKLEKRWRNFFNRFWAHYHCHSSEEWAEMGESAGFEVIESFAYNPRKNCMVNTALTPFGLPAMFFKKVINRWTIWPSIRRLFMAPAVLVLSRIIEGAEKCEEGGLVFISLRKPIR